LCAVDLLQEGSVSQCSVLAWGAIHMRVERMTCERVALVLTSIFPRTGKLTP
jgi:hypothetical protein